jgi:hypothetical protein
MGRRIVVRGHGAQHGFAHVVQDVVIQHVAGADQLHASLRQAAFRELLGQRRALSGRNEDEQRIGRSVADALEERRIVGVAQRCPQLERYAAAGAAEALLERLLGIEARSVVGDERRDVPDAVPCRPVRHRRRRPGQ